MLAAREKVLTPSESNFKSISRSDKKFEAFWHYHPEYEITLILNGQGQRMIGDEIMSYSAPVLFFMPPNVPHTCISEHETDLQRALVIQFSRECFGGDFFNGIDFQELENLFKNTWIFPEQTAYAAEILMNSIHDSVGLKRIIPLFELLNLLNQSKRQLISQVGNQISVNQKIQDQMNAILSRLLSKEPLNVPALASELGMSQSTFRRFFKKHTGRAIIDFHNEMKINAACLLLQNKASVTISEVANEVGFNNLSHFNRQFLRWKKCPPREYRQRYT